VDGDGHEAAAHPMFGIELGRVMPKPRTLHFFTDSNILPDVNRQSSRRTPPAIALV